MKYQQPKFFTFAAVCLTMFLVGAVSAAAQTSATSSATSTPDKKLDAKMVNLAKRANQEIERRIGALTGLAARIQEMKKLASEEKEILATSIQAQIDALKNLAAKIETDTDIETMRTDVQSVTKSYRIYALVMPQTALLAAADRLLEISADLASLGAKLALRISDAQTAGGDITGLKEKLADLNASVAAAKTKAQAAIDLVSGLVPDQGVSEKMALNASALNDARKLLKDSRQEIKDARKDAGDIASALKKLARQKIQNASSTSATTTLATTTPE